MPLNDFSFSRLFKATLLTLTEIIFYLYFAYCYSFIVVVRDSYNERGVSFA